MTYTDFNEDGEQVLYAPVLAHYHGDFVRMLFLAAAILILLMQFTGSGLPVSPVAIILFVTLLVVAAGITNPVQRTVHWFNVLISFTGLMIFGSIALNRLHSLRSFFTHDGLAAVITVVFVMALYLATRTVRSNILGANKLLDSTE